MNDEEEALPRIRAEHQGCDELCDAALLLREVDRLTEAQEAAEQDCEEHYAEARQLYDRAERAEADLADEKRRHADDAAQLARLGSLDLQRAARVIRKVAGGQKRHPNTAALLMNLAGELEAVRALTDGRDYPMAGWASLDTATEEPT